MGPTELLVRRVTDERKEKEGDERGKKHKVTHGCKQTRCDRQTSQVEIITKHS